MLSLQEIRTKAQEFAHEWQDASNERAESQNFWADFIQVFGLKRRRIATFEQNVKLIKGSIGRIDLFIKGKLLVEQKSRGADLDKAYAQGLGYLEGLTDDELPKYVLVSDFERFRLYNLDEDSRHDFTLTELPLKIELFDFLTGYRAIKPRDEDPANIQAAELLGELHDYLAESGYPQDELKIWMVRILFCLFAEHTGIFLSTSFTEYLEQGTTEDGKDLGVVIQSIFQVLNTPPEKRGKFISEELKEFEYVNGDLFSEMLSMPYFNAKGRVLLLKCCHFDWSKISPAIFGSLFQSVMDPKERRNLGAHYTSEHNILKAINSLFLDDLKRELEKARRNAPRLEALHQKIARMRVLDPACGCGNFLIIAYRELRRLEIEVLREKWIHVGKIDKQGHLVGVLDVKDLSELDVDAFYGIEKDTFASEVARVALYMTDHLCNLETSSAFGSTLRRLPLQKSPNILNANALRMDWRSLLPSNECTHIVGNPPFIGSKMMTVENREELKMAFVNGNSTPHKGIGVLDYVTAWYAKAANYIKDTPIRVAFVSTNSIAQGEQVGILWQFLQRYGVRIHFAHQTFKWQNEARGNAAVYCVIIGFGNQEAEAKYLFTYPDIKGEPVKKEVTRINGYLVEGPEIILLRRSEPLSEVPEMIFGNMPNDGGHFLLDVEQKELILGVEPNVSKFIRPFLGAKEYLNGELKYCIWLNKANPDEIKNSKTLMKVIQQVKKYRLKSERTTTVELAEMPHLFAEIRQPLNNYILFPRVSSERRKYIPFSTFSPDKIVGDTCLFIETNELYHLGVLTSLMHMAWMRYVAGRLKSDYRYSVKIVYNNFPWPENPTLKQISAVEAAAQAVLDARKQYPDSTLAVLYDPLTMPKPLLEAHRELDWTVDKCYRPEKFTTEEERVVFLFELYRKLDNPLMRELKAPKFRKKRSKE